MLFKKFFYSLIIGIFCYAISFQEADAKTRNSNSGYSQFGASTILKKTSWGVEFPSNIEDKLKKAGFSQASKTRSTTLYQPDPDNDYDDVAVRGLVKSYVKNTTLVTLYIVNEGTPYVQYCTVECKDNSEKQRLISEFKKMGFQGNSSSLILKPCMFTIEINGLELTLSYSYI